MEYAKSATKNPAAIGDSNMWKIKKQFLQQQISQGKSFALSHNPSSATGYFAKKVNFLKSQGYSFVNEGSIWKAVKK